jgi:hypothetical protein
MKINEDKITVHSHFIGDKEVHLIAEKGYEELSYLEDNSTENEHIKYIATENEVYIFIEYHQHKDIAAFFGIVPTSAGFVMKYGAHGKSVSLIKESDVHDNYYIREVLKAIHVSK